MPGKTVVNADMRIPVNTLQTPTGCAVKSQTSGLGWILLTTWRLRLSACRSRTESADSRARFHTSQGFCSNAANALVAYPHWSRASVGTFLLDFNDLAGPLPGSSVG